jgi:hypothetical protein
MSSKKDIKREIRSAISDVNRDAVNSISDDDADGVLNKEKLREYRRNLRLRKRD